MQVTLISYPSMDADKLTGMAAALCYDGTNPERSLEHALGGGHQSVIEHANFTFLIEGVSRALLAQLTRHRIASFCLSGDTVIGYSQKNKGETIKELAEKASQYQRMTRLRSVNENTREIVQNGVVRAWRSGEKEVFKLETEDGYSIKATKQHLFLTENGWKTLGEISIGEKVLTNGIDAYKSLEWLKEKYHNENLSQKEIGDICGVKQETIRKWVAKFGLQKDMGSWCIGKEPPNKGRTKENYAPLRSVSQKITGRGKANNRVYKLSENPKTISGGYFATYRKNVKSGVCSICGEEGKTELHHKDRNPKNYSTENVIELCVSCHKRQHKGSSIKAVKPSIVKSIEYVGKEMTYDIEMQAPYNNFVANGFVVHNSVQSQRYVSMKDKFDYVVPPRIKALGLLHESEFCKQMSQIHKWYCEWQETLREAGYDKEESNEDARFVLPNAATTRLMVTMNARNLHKFFGLRCCGRAQWEIREMAGLMLEEVKIVAPKVFEKAGPPCAYGPCPEGSRSCGKPWRKREAVEGLC